MNLDEPGQPTVENLRTLPTRPCRTARDELEWRRNMRRVGVRASGLVLAVAACGVVATGDLPAATPQTQAGVAVVTAAALSAAALSRSTQYRSWQLGELLNVEVCAGRLYAQRGKELVGAPRVAAGDVVVRDTGDARGASVPCSLVVSAEVSAELSAVRECAGGCGAQVPHQDQPRWLLAGDGRGSTGGVDELTNLAELDLDLRVGSKWWLTQGEARSLVWRFLKTRGCATKGEAGCGKGDGRGKSMERFRPVL